MPKKLSITLFSGMLLMGCADIPLDANVNNNTDNRPADMTRETYLQLQAWSQTKAYTTLTADTLHGMFNQTIPFNHAKNIVATDFNGLAFDHEMTPIFPRLVIYQADQQSQFQHQQTIVFPFDVAAYMTSADPQNSSVRAYITPITLNQQASTMLVEQLILINFSKAGFMIDKLFLIKKSSDGHWHNVGLIHENSFKTISAKQFLNHLSSLHPDGQHLINDHTLFEINPETPSLIEKYQFSDDYLGKGHFSEDGKGYIAQVMTHRGQPDTDLQYIDVYKTQQGRLQRQQAIRLPMALRENYTINEVMPNTDHTLIAAILDSKHHTDGFK